MENHNSFLQDKICTSCQGGILQLSYEKISQFLLELNGNWHVNKLGRLQKEYNFNNFVDAINFANKVAVIAEEEAHHPDLIISWGKCVINIWTYKINGLTENDFILAAKIGTI